MDFFSWVDHRTLIACHCLLAAGFGTMLLASRRLQPKLEGIGSLSLGCFLAVPTTMLLAAMGNIPDFWSKTCSTALLFLSYIFLYRGILLFCAARNRRLNDGLPVLPVHRQVYATGDAAGRARWQVYKGHLALLCVLSAAAIGTIAYFTYVHPRFNVQVDVVLATLLAARVLMAVALFRNAAGRRQVLLFGYSLAGFAALNAYHLIVTLLHGAPADLMQYDQVQTPAWIASLIFTGVNGMFYLTMINTTVNEMIEEKAMLDFVTSTLNRRGIEKALDAELERAHRTGAPVSVLVIDVDHFKAVNDRLGHAAGDEWLRAVAGSIAETVRVYDRLGRFGGDEFLLLLPETSGEQAMFLAARLNTAIRSLNPVAGGPRPTVSIGVTHSVAEETTGEIFSRADAALYQAKQAGRDCARMQLPGPAPATEPADRRVAPKLG